MTARSHARSRHRAPRTGLLGRLLDPIDILSQAIYSVLILLTFTLAFGIVAAGGQPPAAERIRELPLAVLGATLAWGLIDGLMYALMDVFQRGERHRLLQQIQSAATESEGVEVIAEELDYILEPITGEGERQALYRSVLAQLRRGSPRPIGFRREDFAGALGCLLVAILAVLPSLVPLVLLGRNPALALRVSNVVSFAVLFWAGYRWGSYTGVSPWRTGLLLVATGCLLVAIAIPLGG